MAFNGGFDRQHYAVTGLLFNILEKTQMKHPSIFKASPLLAALLIANNALAQEQAQDNSPVTLETVKVNADFRELDLQQIPSAITVVGQDDIQKRNADHLESILSLAPNVNYSAGASRGRYFQIRGIGERSQFVDAVNPSVGLIIDGVDMTGLGGAATLFDVQQVEILRGPQGTAFGANALAGAINIKSKQPTKETEGYVEAKAGNYNSKGLGGAISGSITDTIQARVAINKTSSDGYMENDYLNRDDTNNIDELVARAQLDWKVNTDNDINLSLLKTDIDNGYDAFSLDNNHTTYSDNPGQDTQDSTAFSLGWNSKLSQSVNLETKISSSHTDTTYSYDEDWSYGVYDANGNCITDCIVSSDPLNYVYSTFDEYNREYSRNDIDVRFLSGSTGRIFNNSTDWIAGTYSNSKKENLNRQYSYDYEDSDNLGTAITGTTPYSSDIRYKSSAIYTELSTQLSVATQITYGLRVEDWTTDFTDNSNIDEDQGETLWGGKATFESLINEKHLAYTSIARGYKAGGINSDPDVNEANRTFESETNNSIELGLKSELLTNTLTTSIAAFYIQRKNQQVKSSYVIPSSVTGGAPVFQDYLGNAAEGKNYGLEFELFWALTNTLNLKSSVGYLKTEFVDYSYTTEDGTFTKDGRSQAHAPEYTLSNQLSWNPTGNITASIGFVAMDEFYFSDSHDEKSKAYVTWNAFIKYSRNHYEISVNGQNLTDTKYATRGFGFGSNDPRANWEGTDQYTQLAAPRLVSINARYNF